MKNNSISIENQLPLVTVLVGCYNHESFVIEALESVRGQNYENIQLIIWDDKSRDNSVEVIRSWIQKYAVECTFLDHSVNVGVCKSLNEAMALARGKYVSMMAADDAWMPEKLNRQVRLLERLGPDYGLLFSDAIMMDENGEATGDTFHSKYFNDKQFSGVTSWVVELFQGNVIHALAATYRTEVIKQSGGYDESLFAEDWDMHIRLSMDTQIHFDSEYVSAKYRILAGSLSNDPEKRASALNSSCMSLAKHVGIDKTYDCIIFRNIEIFSKEMREIGVDQWRRWSRYLFVRNPSRKNIKPFLRSLF